MSEEVLINVGLGETRVAVVENGRPVDIVLERTNEEDVKAKTGRAGHSLLGNIFLGRVQRVLPGMQAAFVDIGLDRAGFLGVREARCLCYLPSYDAENLPPINTCVHEGQSILVQVVKDPIGEKGARLSANVTIPGRLLVLVPNQSGIALSRRIENEEERERLTAQVEGIAGKLQAMGVTGEPAGFIVRTAALAATEAEIIEDAKRITDEWKTVRELEKQSSPPSVVFHDLDTVSRTLRDYVSLDTARVLIDDAASYGEARRYCERAMPEVLDRIELFNGPDHLFSLYGIEEEIEKALEPRVELPSGGWITIETTEALTAIDVNSGKYTAATGLEETSARINLEAVEAIIHQLRLRGTGGLIVIDFIHMGDPGNIEKVLTALRSGFERDRVPTQISGMSEFGLVEMTRKRTREPLDKLMTESTCAKGRPRMKTAATMGNEVIRRIIREAAGAPGRPVEVYLAPDVADWMEGGEGHLMERLRAKLSGPVELIREPRFDRERAEIGIVT